MNKNLIAAAILLLAGYLAYDTYSESNEVDLDAIATIDHVVIDPNEPDKADEELEDYDDNTDVLNGVYLVNVVSTIAETSQEYTFERNFNVKVVRSIVVPASDGRSFTASGTYELNKSNVVLTLDKDRNTKFFPSDTMRFKMLKDGNLKYDKLIIEKQ